MITAVNFGDYRQLYKIIPQDEAIHIFFVRDLRRINGIALGPRLVLVADVTSVNDYRATSHEIGHLLGLSHTDESRNRLMFQGVNGEKLEESEIQASRKGVNQL